MAKVRILLSGAAALMTVAIGWSPREHELRAEPTGSVNFCLNCIGWGPSEHGTDDLPQLHDRDHGFHWSYMSGPCHADNPGNFLARHFWTCTESHDANLQYPSVVSAVDGNDIASLADIVAEHPDIIVVNSERSSVQLVGCNSEIIANFPLPTDLLSKLERLLDK